MQGLQAVVEDLQKEYEEQELGQIEFLEVVARLQPFQPLIEYMKEDFFIKSYQELSLGVVTLSVALEFVKYVIEENKSMIIGKDIAFYQDLISQLMEDEVVSVPTSTFASGLMDNKDLNQSLKKTIITYFERENQIEIKRLREVVYEIHNQLKTQESFQTVGRLEVSSNKISPVISLKSAAESIETSKQYIQEYKEFMGLLEVELTMPETAARLYSFKSKHEGFFKQEKEAKQRMGEKVQELEGKCREKDDEIERLAETIEEHDICIAELQMDIVQFEKKEAHLSEENTNLRGKIGDVLKDYQKLSNIERELRERLTQIANENKGLKRQLQQEQNLNYETPQGIDQSSPEERQLNKKESIGFSIQEINLKLSLDDAQTRLELMDKKYQLQLEEIKDSHSAKMHQLERKIEQLKKGVSLNNEMDGLDIRWDRSRIEDINPIGESVVRPYLVPRPSELPRNSQIPAILESQIIGLPIQFKIAQKPQRNTQESLNIKKDLNDFYKYDYCDISELDPVKEILQKERKECDYDQQYMEMRLLFLSCDVQLLKENGDHFNFTLLVGPMRMSFISGSKHTTKDQIMINQIARIVLPTNSQILILTVARDNDLVLFTNRRKELVRFLNDASSYQGFGICVVRVPPGKTVEVKQNKSRVSLSKFKGAFISPYWMSLQYSWFTHGQMEQKGMFNKDYKDCFIVVNEGGVFIFKDDFLTTKFLWKQKLIVCIPITPLLVVGRLGKKVVKLGFQERFKEHKDVILICKSIQDQIDLTTRINRCKQKILLENLDKIADETKFLQSM